MTLTSRSVFNSYYTHFGLKEGMRFAKTVFYEKDADDVLIAFERQSGDPDIELADNPPSINRITWELIQKVLQEHDGNISATARALGMHRRTLQRKLQKRPVRR